MGIFIDGHEVKLPGDKLALRVTAVKQNDGTEINPATTENISALSDAVTAALAPATTFAGGTKTVTLATTPEALVADSTPCKRVWIGPRVNADGVPQNTKPVFIGDTTGQNVPITVANLEGMVFSIDNAAKLFVKVGVDGEGVEYRILA